MEDAWPAKDAVRTFGPAYRYPQAGWIYLHIEGAPYERGYQHGYLMAREIPEYLERCAADMGTNAAGEMLFSADEFDAYLAKGALAVVQPDVTRLGGITPWLKVAARAEQHWKVSKAGDGAAVRTAVVALSAVEREEEIARMLSGAQVTPEARAAARALISA